VQSRFRDATEEGGLAKTLDASGKATPILTEDFASTLGLDSSKFPSSAELRASGTELALYDQYSASKPNIDANISDLTRSMHGSGLGDFAGELPALSGPRSQRPSIRWARLPALPGRR
jgi:hypothetical protein